ncbi:Holliday junction branch migration protein RuvA [Thiohalomonas denitrificans]|uniref:Holliday junction branch migration complex subunit RuvA n=1 Tax=Thiohalomonas denitrificans TaxID=415747 RepID=A0A1G5PLP5_9GAMM|nr:Holliday junction branch migration protein RuvA [Thiohalomonas denitrificans]SCZ50121.1 Holliday junction DNA helicase subunit RuvA [Thiohalomonas denitrificans]
MIGRLRGLLAEKQPPQLLMDVNGVGYEIEAPMSTFYQLPALGSEMVLYTHLVVRDDAHLLFGFASETERRLFRTLIKVNGVGAKLALTILSGISADEFARCIQDDDTASLVRLPGVGKKTAERLIVEMRDRLNDWQIPGGVHIEAVASAGQGSVSGGIKDAIAALVSLGYKPQEASRLISKVETEGLDSEALIRAALKQAVSR